MKPEIKHRLVLALLLLAAPLLSGALTGHAQTGGDYRLAWSSVDGGGAASGGGAYQVGGLAGQSDAGQALAGGNYRVEGGFLNHTSIVQGYGHVAFIVPWVRDLGGGRYLVLALVRILGRNGLPVGTARVDAVWRLYGGPWRPQSAITNSSGLARLYRFTQVTGTFQFCVTALVKEGWVYDAAANAETCDSVSVP